ncbi:hypothetical protein ACFPJ1_01665 [Kribbella qitaiheensis]|uniref:hypothetical protein n=1 Tax=Kribbella qitaiheensis TaxID=1544730 RepID=UPI0036115A28
MSETEAAQWTTEFAKTGEVRVPPRRSVTALKTLLYGFLLANEIGAVVSAALGRQNWRWWPLFCLVAAPALIPLIWWYVRMALFGRPVLVVDKDGVSLGRERLTWENVKTVESPNSVRRRPPDPRRPVDASREWFGLVTVVPATQRRTRQISVGKDHVRDLEGLGAWLDALRRQKQTGSRGV